MSGQPAIHVLAGVNGAGKSSIGGAAIRSREVDYYNPDEAARLLLDFHPAMTQVIANSHAWSLGRELLESAIVRRTTFAFETTLGGQTITDLLRRAIAEGLPVKIWYAGLESVELHLERVRKRVARGGHDIPAEAIRRRWDQSRRNLIRLLPGLAALRVYDNSLEADPHYGIPPRPRLLLAMVDGRITGPADLSHAPEWARPILGAALKLHG